MDAALKTHQESWIGAFLEYLRIDRGVSEKTIEAYRLDLRQFLARSTSSGLDSIESQELEDFLGWLQKQNMKPSSIARKVSALRQFFKFHAIENHITNNPTELLPSPTQAKKLPKYLTLDSIKALLEQSERGLAYPGSERPHLVSRDRAMIYLLYATGLRVSEMVGLSTHSLDLEQGYLRVRGKGEKERITPFAPIAGEKVQEYLENHRGFLGGAKGPATDHLFLNLRGLGLSRQSLWKIIQSLAEQAGLAQNISPHMLRHSFATHLLQSGMNLRSLQMLLGHSDLSTTQIYASVSPEHLKESHRKYHPRGGG